MPSFLCVGKEFAAELSLPQQRQVDQHPVQQQEGDVAATANYGMDFHAAVWRDNVFACQFHPEKSSEVGLKILKNFIGL